MYTFKIIIKTGDTFTTTFRGYAADSLSEAYRLLTEDFAGSYVAGITQI